MRLTNASPILFSILVSPTVVLYLREWKGGGTRGRDVRSDEELVLNIHEMLRELNCYRKQSQLQRQTQYDREELTFQIGVLNRVLDPIGCTQ